MKHTIKTFGIVLFLTIFFSQSAFSQCKQFIEAMGAGMLAPYTMDGNFASVEIYEGDDFELTRTFLKGQRYKISVIGMELFERKITITDPDGFTVFQNYQGSRREKMRFYTDIDGNQIPHWGSPSFEFVPEQSQNLTIKVKLSKRAKRKRHRMKGCLGIVVGFASDK